MSFDKVLNKCLSLVGFAGISAYKNLIWGSVLDGSFQPKG